MEFVATETEYRAALDHIEVLMDAEVYTWRGAPEVEKLRALRLSIRPYEILTGRIVSPVYPGHST